MKYQAVIGIHYFDITVYARKSQNKHTKNCNFTIVGVNQISIGTET